MLLSPCVCTNVYYRIHSEKPDSRIANHIIIILTRQGKEIIIMQPIVLKINNTVKDYQNLYNIITIILAGLAIIIINNFHFYKPCTMEGTSRLRDASKHTMTFIIPSLDPGWHQLC